MSQLNKLSTQIWVLLTGIMLGFYGCQINENDTKRFEGAIADLGNGIVESYVEIDADEVPTAIGVTFSEGSLDNLPEELTDGHRCADLDGNEVIDTETECLPWHERVIPLPAELSRRSDVPFHLASRFFSTSRHS